MAVEKIDQLVAELARVREAGDQVARRLGLALSRMHQRYDTLLDRQALESYRALAAGKGEGEKP